MTVSLLLREQGWNTDFFSGQSWFGHVVCELIVFNLVFRVE